MATNQPQTHHKTHQLNPTQHTKTTPNNKTKPTKHNKTPKNHASAHDSNARFFWWFVSVWGMSKSSGRLICPCDVGVLPCHPVCDGNEDDDDD